MIERKRAAALDAALAAMFRALQSRGVPERVRATLDDLEGAEAAGSEPERKRA
jgi:hypothetical protein